MIHQKEGGQVHQKEGGQVHQKEGGQVHPKDDGQVGKTIYHYPAFRDPVQREKILEKLGEGYMSALIKKYNRLIPQSEGCIL
jgi:hypothetical protein